MCVSQADSGPTAGAPAEPRSVLVSAKAGGVGALPNLQVQPSL